MTKNKQLYKIKVGHLDKHCMFFLKNGGRPYTVHCTTRELIPASSTTGDLWVLAASQLIIYAFSWHKEVYVSKHTFKKYSL